MDTETIKIIVSVIAILVSLGAGGLAGAFYKQWRDDIRRREDLTLRQQDLNLDNSRRKQEITLNAFNYFLQIYTMIGEVKYLLQNKNAELLKDTNNQNKVRKVADWMNLIAILADKGSIDTDLLDRIAIKKEMKTFHTLVNNSMSQSNVFNDAWTLWPQLDIFSRNT